MKWYCSYKNQNWCLWFDHAIVHNTWQLVVTKWHTCILQQTLLRLVHKKWGNNTLPAVTNHIWTENKKNQHIYDTTSNRNSIESSRPLPTCGKNREGPISFDWQTFMQITPNLVFISWNLINPVMFLPSYHEHNSSFFSDMEKELDGCKHL